MRWPDIFFKAKPPKTYSSGLPPQEPNELTSETEAQPAEGGTDPTAEPPTASDAAPSPRLPVSRISLPPAPVHPVSADSGVVQEMNEADTLRQLTRSGGIRLVKMNFAAIRPSESSTPPPVPEPIVPPVSEAVVETESISAPSTPEPELTAPAPIEDEKKAPAPGTRGAPSINLFGTREPAAPAPYPSATTILRRRMRMADVARIVLPPRREESITLPPISPSEAASIAVPIPESPASSPETAALPVDAPTAVVPPSFPVSVPTGSFLLVESQPEEKDSAAEAEVPSGNSTEKRDEPSPASPSFTAEPSRGQIPDPETAPASPSNQPGTPPKKEFVLSNGERLFGNVLSETADSIYLNHSTLGVLTIPRAQIAHRPVEIILINGDRIVGDIVAETPDSLFVRHASLGILTVPRNQQSTRVVEAILKDGDRILGEVLGETENFTVIRSATLGTVAVPHNRVAMLNRRAEQMQMKALPALENKAENS